MKMVWDAFIAIYLFLAGLGAGAFVLGALTNWAKKPAPAMKKIAFIVGPVAVAVGTLVLVVDAHAGFNNPMRFFLLISNLGSVMSWGVIILSVFLVVSIIDLIVLLVKKSTPKALDIVGAVMAVCVAAYTGVLLGDAGVAFPLWNMAILPVLFVVSAASTGFAIVMLVTHLAKPEETEALPFMGKVGLALPVLELALVIVLLAVTATADGSAAAAASASVANLISGPYAVAFWLGFIAIGLVLPFCLEMVRHRKGVGADPATSEGLPSDRPSGASDMTLALAGECAVLVGGFMLRYLVIMAAVAVALV
ncbi:polysulfide reductase [Rubneribacter badeniensis]|uniref:Polysulfide reductase n=2 Tax=Rubneribacter badeniensis TaxID=2070688 RepID=A0A2K2U316_9ACTN|nr:polysulfide reductase [Rubneribacter badeniensis]